jgi:uncharacterized membrane protein YkvA (DUF1232 family)
MSPAAWAAVAAGVLLTLYFSFILWLLAAGRRGDARAVAGFVPDCLVLLRRLLADDRVARRDRLLLAAVAVYLATPIDLVPDFIPVAGQLDDAIIVAVVLRSVLRAAGEAPIREHWPGPPQSLDLIMRTAV